MWFWDRVTPARCPGAAFMALCTVRYDLESRASSDGTAMPPLPRPSAGPGVAAQVCGEEGKLWRDGGQLGPL